MVNEIPPDSIIIGSLLKVIRDEFKQDPDYTFDEDRTKTKIIIENSYPFKYEQSEKRPLIIVNDPIFNSMNPRYNMGAMLPCPKIIYYAIENQGEFEHFPNYSIYHKHPNDIPFTDLGLNIEEDYFVCVYLKEIKISKIAEISEDQLRLEENVAYDNFSPLEILIIKPHSIEYHYGDNLIAQCSII